MHFLCGMRKVLRGSVDVDGCRDSVLEFRFRIFVVTAILVLP